MLKFIIVLQLYVSIIQGFNIFPRLLINNLNKKSDYICKSHVILSKSTNYPKPFQITSSRRATIKNNIDVEIPDKNKFAQYFSNTIQPGNEMNKDQFMKYGVVNELIDNGLVYADDIDDLWVSVVADADGLTLDEAFEMLCMVTDIPDPEDVKFLNDEYIKLAGKDNLVSFFNILNWSDVKDILDEEALSMEEISTLWRSVAGDLDSKINKKQFFKFNRAIDDAIEEKEEAEDEVADEELESDENVVDITGVDVWDASFDPVAVFSSESLAEITDYFTSVAGSVDGTFSFKDLIEWPDMQDMVSEGSLTSESLQQAWREATANKDSSSSIDFDTFLRLNVRLDLLMDELEEASEQQTSSQEVEINSKESLDEDEQDAEAFYRDEFRLIAGGKDSFLQLEDLLQWSEIADLISEGAVSTQQITKLFDGMPQQPIDSSSPDSKKGISEDTFVALNSMLDVLIDAASGDGEKMEAAAPATLVSEAPRPMPAGESELKMGSLPVAESEVNEDPTSGLSGKELEMMEVLDQADNMLNSGSFGDFDQLIGDINDPRLAALREKREGATEVSGQLNDNVNELLNLASAQSRCGLDRPEEEEAARIRDLIQGVIEKASPLSEKSIPELRSAICGKWKLLYTNSEMFDFYNGVTGLTNVFPSTKFKDLSVEYISDGYLSESKYYEQLTTPLGALDCTVFGNWDVVKEMSFMTNQNSVVLRNYCTKVTAGPMEYEAQENWKSLRTLSMNEVVYIDDSVMISRNCGALRIYFVFKKEN